MRGSAKLFDSPKGLQDKSWTKWIKEAEQRRFLYTGGTASRSCDTHDNSEIIGRKGKGANRR